MRVVPAITFILAHVLVASAAVAQTGTITGRVVDTQTRQPLVGVQVHAPAARVGTLTNSAGRYVLPNVPVGQVTLRAELIGYTAGQRVVPVRAQQTTTSDFDLMITTLALDELVVSVEAGTMRRAELGTDVARVNVERAVKSGAVESISQLLQARTAGVSVTRGSGLSGSGSRIRIRGPATLTQDNNPLIVVDGVRMSNNTTDGTSATSGGGTSRFDDLAPEEIADIQIIKGPAATALYGTEAAPGVIVIKTKRGAVGTPTFSLGMKYGTMSNTWDYPDNYADVTEVYGVTDVTDPRIAQFNAVKNPVTGQVFITHNPFRNEGTTPFLENVNLQGLTGSVTGGTQGVNYFASAEYAHEDGIVAASRSKRLNARANLDFSLRQNLKTILSFGVVNSDRNYPQDNSTASGFGVNGFLGSPIAAYGDDPVLGAGKGICARDALQRVPDGTTRWCTNRNGNVGQSFDKILTESRGEKVYRVSLSAAEEWMPWSWFINRFTIGSDRTERGVYNRTPFDPDLPFGNSSLGNTSDTRYTTDMLTVDYTGTIEGALGANIKRWSTFGAQWFSQKNASVGCSGNQYPNDLVAACGSGFIVSGSNGRSEQREMGIFGQQRVGFKDVLFLTGALRADDNAALGVERGAILSPSVNASLVVSQLPFWKISQVNDFRLRAAWGTASQSPAPYSADQTYTSVPVVIGGVTVGGVSPGNPGNPDLGPERSSELELGVDLGLFASRAGLTFTYFKRNVRDLIVPKPVAPSSGFANSALVNLGLMESTGLELMVNANLVRREKISIDMTFTHSHYDPVITDLGLPTPIFFPVGADGGSRAAGSQVFATGFAPGAYVSPQVIRATRDASGRITTVELAPGNVVEGDSRRVVGSPWPDGEQTLFTSINLLSRVTISALFDRVYGADLLNVTRAFRSPFVDTNTGLDAYGREYAFRQAESTPEQQAMIERQYFGAFLESGDYVKFREVNVRYVLPTFIADRINAGSASVTVAGRNLKTWTDFTILDPEMDVQGSRDNFIRNNFAGSFPPLRTFWLGINLTF
jgi:TonB-linked SusC/RagA family outer membrane protein